MAGRLGEAIRLGLLLDGEHVYASFGSNGATTGAAIAMLPYR